MRISDKIEESGWFSFEDGMLGSTNHCVGYYYHYDEDGINEIISEDYLMDRVWGKEDWEEIDWNEEDESYEEFFDRYFGDGGMEIIEDDVEGGLGYSKIVVDNINRNIRVSFV